MQNNRDFQENEEEVDQDQENEEEEDEDDEEEGEDAEGEEGEEEENMSAERYKNSNSFKKNEPVNQGPIKTNDYQDQQEEHNARLKQEQENNEKLAKRAIRNFFNHINVSVRVAPFTVEEKSNNSESIVEIQDGKTIVVFHPESNEGLRYMMDNIFTEETNIDTLFTEIGLPAVNATLEGFNSCIIMYGATKTGKSAIFWGNNPQEQIGAFDQLGKEVNPNLFSEGLVLKCCKHIFNFFENDCPENFSFFANVQAWEMSDHTILDLLNPVKENSAKKTVKRHPQLGVYLDGVSTTQISNLKQISEILEEVRSLSYRLQHTRGLRYHTFIKLSFIKEDALSPEKTVKSSIMFVNLKGSERVSKKQAMIKPQFLKECASINNSLIALGCSIYNVVNYTRTQLNLDEFQQKQQQKLRSSAKSNKSNKNAEEEEEEEKNPLKGVSKHIVSLFQNSKLVTMLSEALCGSHATSVVGNISPADYHYLETMDILENLRICRHIPCFPIRGDMESIKSLLYKKIQLLRSKLPTDPLAEGHPPTEEQEEVRKLEEEYNALLNGAANIENGEDDEENTNRMELVENINPNLEVTLKAHNLSKQKVSQNVLDELADRQNTQMAIDQPMMFEHEDMKTFQTRIFAQLEKSMNEKKQMWKKSAVLGERNGARNKMYFFTAGEKKGETKTEVYKGGWEADKKSGFGKYVTEAWKYEGGWKNDKRDGFGVLWRRIDKESAEKFRKQPYFISQKHEADPIVKMQIQERKKSKYKNEDEKKKLIESLSVPFDVQAAKKAEEKRKKNEESCEKLDLKTKKKWQRLYQGEWRNGLKEGKGVYFFDNGEIYDGEWLADNRHGQGCTYKVDGTKFVGEWKNDKAEGFGMRVYQNGDVYVGKHENGKKHGEGVYYYISDQKKYKGIWVEDIPKTGEFMDIQADDAEFFQSGGKALDYVNLPKLGLQNEYEVLRMAQDKLFQ